MPLPNFNIDYCDGEHHCYAVIICDYCENEYCWGCAGGDHPNSGEFDDLTCPHCGVTFCFSFRHGEGGW